MAPVSTHSGAGSGWFQLTYDLALQLVALEPLDVDLHVKRMKEKFGGLWFYMRSALSDASQGIFLHQTEAGRHLASPKQRWHATLGVRASSLPFGTTEGRCCG